MEDSWVYIDDDDDDASNCSVDSDKIDSETEAELYSKIHHEQNLTFINPMNLNEQPSGLFVYSEFKDFLRLNNSQYESTLGISDYSSLNINNISCEKRKSSEMDADCKIFNENLSAKKHKTESTCLDENVDLNSNNLKKINNSPKFLENNSNNKNSVLITNDISNNISNNTETVKQYSSDSDCDIWIEENSTQKSDLKINLMKETDAVFLSSGSDIESDVSSSIARRDSFLKNLSMPNIRIEENPKGLWYINSEDLRRSRKQSHRYHDNFDITCSNCNKKGHTFRTCPSPKVIKCFICGGNHMGFRCSNRVCSNCHTIGHDRRNCPRETYKEFCRLCNMKGHGIGNCPDIWRRYHLTTNPLELKKGKQVQQNSNLYCWNCGKCGHFGAVCQLSHLSRSNFNTLPCVISYSRPKKLLKLRLSILKKYSFLNMQKLNRNINTSYTSSGNRIINLEPENQLNVSAGSNRENKKNKNRNRKLKTASRFDKIQDIINGTDFPRTSKKIPDKCNSPVQSEGIKSPSLMKTEFNKLRKKYNKKLKKCPTALNEECSLEFDPDLPASVKRIVERNFKRWRKNRLKRIRKKQNKADMKKESIQNHGLH